MNGLCVSCGKKVEKSSTDTNNSNIMVTLNGGVILNVSEKEAERVEKSKVDVLHKLRKLGLILDIDHTLLRATDVHFLPPPSEMEKYGLHSIALPGDAATAVPLFHLIKLRPHLAEFLAAVSRLFELSIYTAGTRAYAESVVRLSDPDGSLFRGRIVSRSDSADEGAAAGEKSLDRLFVGDAAALAVMLDDREDVWRGPQSAQLLLVRPFKYFPNARNDNNAPGEHVGGLTGGASPRPPYMPPPAQSPAAPGVPTAPEQYVVSMHPRPGDLRRLPEEHVSLTRVCGLHKLAIALEDHYDDLLLRFVDILTEIHAGYYALHDQQQQQQQQQQHQQHQQQQHKQQHKQQQHQQQHLALLTKYLRQCFHH